MQQCRVSHTSILDRSNLLPCDIIYRSGAGDCTYTPADPNQVTNQPGCVPTVFDYCTNLDLSDRYITTRCGEDPHPDWRVPGGCVYTAASNISGVVVTPSCTSIVQQAECAAADTATCGTIPGCTWQEAETVPESCVARDKAACDAVIPCTGDSNPCGGNVCDGQVPRLSFEMLAVLHLREALR